MSRRVYVIRQRRDKTIEYFSGFRRSFFFISLKEAARSQERECGMVVYSNRRKAKRDYKKLKGGWPLKIVSFRLR